MQKNFTRKQKLWKIMKICAIQGMMVLTLCGVSLAHSNYAQVLDTEVTLNLHSVPFEQALKEIERLTHVKFMYSSDQLGAPSPVTLETTNRPLKDVLDALLTPRHITYNVHEQEASITLKRQGQEKTNERSELQESDRKRGLPIQLTGTVTDAKTNQPMPGVNVIVKGSTVGTTTDAEGKYAINVDKGGVLVFSFIGYKVVEVEIGEETILSIALEEDVKRLDEVVINAGYYTTTKGTQTGNIGTIQAKDIQIQPVSNPLAAMMGRIPGVEIIQSSGVPGGNFTVRIRGTGSIANGNDPLYVIDGVPFTSGTMSMPETASGFAGVGGTSPLNGINPWDIESIEVLKDADATAIYGSRGANGVILITTKKGKVGGTKVDFNFYTGVGHVARKMNLLNSRKYLEMRHEAFSNDSDVPTPANAPDLTVWDTTRFTDWQKELIGGAAHTTDAQLSISGGEKNNQFSIGGGYHKETTVYLGTGGDQRGSVHLNLSNTSPNQKLKTVLTTNYSSSLATLPGNLTETATTLPPIAPSMYDSIGKMSWENWSSVYENPLASTKRIYESRTNNLVGNAIISYAILPNLLVKANTGYTTIGVSAVTTSPASSKDPSINPQNSSSFSNTSFRNWILEPQVGWRPKFGNGQFDLLAGGTFLQQGMEGLSQNASGFSSEALMKNIAAASNRSYGTNYYSQYRYQAFFGRVNYSWKGKYIVNFTGRRDGSSRFGPGRQFATFGAAGLAWIFSEEPLVKKVAPVLSFGKLRGSYGVTGNDQLGDYQYLDSYSSVAGPYQGSIGLQPDRLSNPDFAWESNTKLEAGLELGFTHNRIMTSVSYYQNRSTNQLVGYPLPTTTGFNAIQGNFPAVVQNTGLEIEVTSRNVQSGAFTWTTSVNLTIPKNRLIDFPNLEAFPAYANTYVVGQPLAILKQLEYTGINQATGVYTFNDVNGDGIYNYLDRQSVGFVGRKFYGGFTNHIQFKGFQLDFLFQFVKQTTANYTAGFGQPGSMSNQPDLVLNRWTEPGDQVAIQRFGQNSDPLIAYARLVNSNDFVTDGSFVRMKNVSLSYSLPTALMEKAHIAGARFFIQGQNLLTFTKYKGIDPETQSNSQLPPIRVITAGVHLTL
jgi:TonB-linked SusC/RagA family outer membrane protein